MKILAIDPGGTTGVAWHDFKNYSLNIKPGVSMPKGFGAGCETFSMLIESIRPDLVAIEQFTISARTIKSSREGSNLAIELTGAAKFLAMRANVPVQEQKPSDAKNFVTDEKLKRIGWYVPGPDHARDAIRHLILAAIRNKALEPSVLIS